MGIIKKTFKFVATTIGELAIVGGFGGVMYTIGFLKGSSCTPEVKEVVTEVKEVVKEAVNNKPEQPVESTGEVQEESQEETTEPETPPIEVTTNQQED